MASGDAGEILRQLETVKRELSDIKRKLDEMQRDIRYIKTNGTN